MNRIHESNQWRRDKLVALVAAVKAGNKGQIDRAMLAINIRGANPGDTGFSMSDLSYAREGLIDRADGLTMALANKVQTLCWMKRKVERLDGEVTRAWDRLSRKGGTVPRAALASESATWKAARENAATLRTKIAGLGGAMTAMQADIDAFSAAASLISAVLDARRNHRVEATRARQPVAVVAVG